MSIPLACPSFDCGARATTIGLHLLRDFALCHANPSGWLFASAACMTNRTDRRWVSLLLLCLSSTPACGATARRSAGATVMALGGLTGLTSLQVMAGYCAEHRSGWPDASGESPCSRYQDPNPTAGAMVFTAGLTAVVAGGILLASGMPTKSVTSASAK